ncbi:hypothetical protein ACFL7M_14260 [Thermodesulfobacteriota bacterium]
MSVIATNTTAVATLVVSWLGGFSIWFVRGMFSMVYMELAGPSPCLPSLTVLVLKLTASLGLFIIAVLGLMAIGASQFFLKTERGRFIIQLGYLAVWVLFMAIAFLAFMLPLYIPPVVIE